MQLGLNRKLNVKLGYCKCFDKLYAILLHVLELILLHETQNLISLIIGIEWI